MKTKIAFCVALRASSSLLGIDRKRSMLSLLSSVLLSAFCLSAYAQNPNCYRITFSDKNNSPYSINRPEEYLSPRAIAKRERFNISITEQDLPVNPQYIEAILNFSSEPSQIISKSKWDNSVVIFYPETEDCHDIIANMLNHFSFVIDTLPVAYYQLPFRTEEPDEKNVNYQSQSFKSILSSSCDYDYGNSIDNIKLHKGELLHKAGFCGEGMLICAFDGGWEGFDTISYFKFLYDNGQILGTRDLMPVVNNIYIGGGGHGTAVASMMVSNIQGRMIGVAPQANYFFIRTENPWSENLLEEDFWAYAAEIADSLGADVVSSSVAYNTFDYEWQNLYTSTHNNGLASIASRAASILAQKGVIVVQAAGNSGLVEWRYILRPADAFDILAVGMVNISGNEVAWSSYGPSSDGRVKPDVAALGERVWIINAAGKIVRILYGGTSAATPIIAGLSACLWQALPQYSAIELMQLIRESGDRANNPDDRTGYGIPNFYQCYLDNMNSVPENKSSAFLVYPNPTTGKLQIRSGQVDEWTSGQAIDIEVFDVFGRKQKAESRRQKGVREVVMDISHLSQGIYILRITADGNIYTKKIVKN